MRDVRGGIILWVIQSHNTISGMNIFTTRNSPRVTINLIAMHQKVDVVLLQFSFSENAKCRKVPNLASKVDGPILRWLVNYARELCRGKGVNCTAKVSKSK